MPDKTPSLRPILASQANGRLSRGPVSPERKSRSAPNARFHQLLEAFVHRFILIGRFTPIDDAEALLVEQMAIAQWKLRRLWSIEAASLDHEIDTVAADIENNYFFIDPPTRLALAFNILADRGRALSTLERQRSRLQRDYHRAVTEYHRNEPSEMQIWRNEPNAPEAAA
ncbi:MAG: hypothetical protein R2762_29995 [Bryobacteraceae bacterium]